MKQERHMQTKLYCRRSWQRGLLIWWCVSVWNEVKIFSTTVSVLFRQRRRLQTQRDRQRRGSRITIGLTRNISNTFATTSSGGVLTICRRLKNKKHGCDGKLEGQEMLVREAAVVKSSKGATGNRSRANKQRLGVNTSGKGIEEFDARNS